MNNHFVDSCRFLKNSFRLEFANLIKKNIRKPKISLIAKKHYNQRLGTKIYRKSLIGDKVPIGR